MLYFIGIFFIGLLTERIYVMILAQTDNPMNNIMQKILGGIGSIAGGSDSGAVGIDIGSSAIKLTGR